jgi:serine O-acetyltransferase
MSAASPLPSETDPKLVTASESHGLSIVPPSQPGILRLIREDIASVLADDPAAKSQREIVLCYSGLHAVWAYRLHHWLWGHRFRTLARFLSQLARFITGIEIHPGAQIGRRLFIDHGTGVVIGETAVVGDDVTLYQGVTLGGTSTSEGKRHPTIGNNVVAGSGAKILGNITVGDNCRIGAGSVVLRDVTANSTVVGVPGHVVFQNGKRVIITDPKLIADPLSQALNAVIDRIKELNERISQLEGREVNANYLDGIQRVDAEIEYHI